VPNNSIFAYTPPTQQELWAFEEYSCVSGMVVYSPLLTNGKTFKTVQGSDVTITVQNGSTYVNAAKISVPDYLVSNGVLHVLDKYFAVSSSIPMLATTDLEHPQPSQSK
jgi:uncharacterized surface protein with fasciclin (FAS1) repeats